MNGNKRVSGGQKRPRRRAARIPGAMVARWLIFCLPVGLAMMWRRGCRWRTLNKLAVTIGSLSLALALCLGAVQLIEQLGVRQGGSQLVSIAPQVDVYGPKAPAVVDESYSNEHTISQAVLVTPDPTPKPETAYYKDGGKYFHTENCRHVKGNVPCYSVPHLLELGIKPCKECDAAALAAIYTGG